MDTTHPDPTGTGSIRTTDLYEAAYYLSEGITPKKIECRYLNKVLLCDFFFDASAVDNRQISFFSDTLKVNLLSFRRSYLEAANYANNAKRNYRKQEKKAVVTVSNRRISG